MTIPHPSHISALTQQDRSVNRRKLELDLLAAVKRERAHGTNIADGYSAGGTFDAAGGSGHSNPTLDAFMARREKANRDTLRTETHKAADEYEKAVKALLACEKALAAISYAMGNQPSTPKSCDLCSEAGLKDRPWDHAGTSVAGKLDRSLYLCTAHYQLIHRTGQEPSVEQTLHWDRTGSWRIRESA